MEIDPEVLVTEPPLWFRLEAGAGRRRPSGTLLCGATALRRLSLRVDREAAQAVFKVSGLE